MIKKNCLFLFIFFALFLPLFITPARAECPSIFFQDSNGNYIRQEINEIVQINNLSATSQYNNTQNNPNSTVDADSIIQAPDPADPKKLVPLYIDSKGTITTKSAGNSALTRAKLIEQFGKRLSASPCPPNIKDLQTLFLRLVVIVNSIIGAVTLFVLCKAAFIRITSRGNMEAVKKSAAMITAAMIGLAIVIGAYSVLVFIGTRLLPQNECFTYSFVDSGKILFFFDQSDISPVLAEDYKKILDNQKTLPPQCQN